VAFLTIADAAISLSPMSRFSLQSAALPAALLCVSVFALPLASHADLVYRPNEGWVKEGVSILGTSAPVAKTADLQLKYAQDMEAKGDFDKASDAYKRLVKVFPLSQQASEARFKLGETLEKRGRFEDAFEAFDELVVKHPESKEFSRALDAMFGIAKRYMSGERRRLFGVKMFASNQRAEEMFDTILKRAPYSRSAAQVMLFRGLVMERQGKDAEALAAYQQIIERFPSDSIADEAQYQMGYIRLRSVKKGSYDHTDRARAQESFEDFLNRAPQNGRTTQARENLQLLESGNRKAALDVAKFYEKTGKNRAAAVYYRDVISKYAGSQEAKYAQERLEALKAALGEEALRVENGAPDSPANAESRKKMQAAVSTSSRPDYVGPKLKNSSGKAAGEGGPEVLVPSAASFRLQEADTAPLPSEAGKSGAGSAEGASLISPRVTPPAPRNP
jgi:outer membrane protein assembly factor BamD